MKLSTYVHLMPRLRKSRAIPQPPLYTVMAWPGTDLPFKHLYNVNVWSAVGKMAGEQYKQF